MPPTTEEVERPREEGSAGPRRSRRIAVRAPRDLLAGSLLVGVAAFSLWASAPLDSGQLRAMGPGMLPRAVAVLVGVSGLGIALVAVLRHGAGLGRWPVRGPLFLALGVAAFAITIRSAGLAVAGPLVVVLSGFGSSEARPRELVVFALVLTAFCAALFRFALHLPIPILVIPGVVTL